MTTAMPGQWVLNTTRERFQEDVIGRSVELPVVLDFWAPWCAPCRALGPVLEKLAEEFGGKFLLVKANTDEVPEAATQFNVQGIPAVFAVMNGEVIDFFSGAMPESALRTWLERVLEAGVLAEARRLEELSVAGAEAKYRQLLAANPKNETAQIGLARTLIAQEQFTDASQVVGELEKRGYLEPEAQKLKAILDLHGKERIDLASVAAAAQAAPRDFAKQFQWAEALAGAGQYDQALPILLGLVEQDRKGAGETARKLMIEIFQALPDGAELTSEYRRKLSRALY